MPPRGKEGEYVFQKAKLLLDNVQRERPTGTSCATGRPQSRELVGSPPNMRTAHGKFCLHLVPRFILKVTLSGGLLQLCIHSGLTVHSDSESESDFETWPTFSRLYKVITRDLCIMRDLCFGSWAPSPAAKFSCKQDTFVFSEHNKKINPSENNLQS